MNWQYSSFFSHLHDILHGDASFVYSFSRAIGGEMLGVFGYYMISPFHLIFYFFDAEHIYEGVFLLTLLKSGSCGLAMYHFLQSKKAGAAGLIFSTAYALSAYMIAYQFNIFWLDGVIILPILILGVERLVENQRCQVYIFALAYGIITNFYIGYMLCIFSVLYFLCYFFLISLAEKRLRTMLLYIGSSLAGGALSGISSLPMLFVLAQGKGAANIDLTQLLQNKTKLFGYWSLFEKSLLGTISEEQMTAGKPLLYCGILTLILVFSWFCNPRNHWREKLGYFLLLIFMLVSLTFYHLNTIWHGLNVPMGSPYRFSFLYIFLLLYIGCQGFVQLHAGSVRAKWDKGVCFCVGAALLICLLWRRHEILESTRTGVWFINALVVCYYVVVLIYSKRQRICTALCMGMISAELVCNAGYLYSYSPAYQGVTATEYDAYYANMQPLLDTIKKDETFFRTVWGEELARTDNDGFMFNIYTLNSYTSVENFNTSVFAGKMGLESTIAFGIHYNAGITKAGEALLGVRYRITGEEGDAAYTLLEKNEDFYLYENPAAFPLAFFTEGGITDVCDTKNNTFQYIADIYQCINPEETGELYEAVAMELVNADNCEKQDAVYRVYENGDDACVEYLAEVQTGCSLYLHFKNSGAYKAQVYKEEEVLEFTADGNQVKIIGTTEADETIRIRFYIKNEEYFNPDEVFLCTESEEILASYVKAVQSQKITVDKKTDSHISIQCENESGNQQYLLCTIPYDEGWKITVDGKKTEAVKAAEHLLAIPIEEGAHEVVLSYIPKGMREGWAVTGMTLFVLAVVKKMTNCRFIVK